jgi:eukaryotic-like serine/threonine-protein kinase
MIRFLRLFAKLLVLIIVALASTLISMRFAIHGREVAVPDFRGMDPAQAERLAAARGLEFEQSDHFYSATVAAGLIASQQPEPGTRVRRGWRVQAADSLGPQLIDIPSLIGLSPRAAEIDIRRRGLEVGAAAELPTDASAPQSILAQTPSARSQGVASPRVSLLYAAPPPEPAYAMPDLTGLTLPQASSLVAASGLKVVSLTTAPAPAPAAGSAALPVASNSPNLFPNPNPQASTVVAQQPAPGSRVTPGTNVSLEVMHSL